MVIKQDEEKHRVVFDTMSAAWERAVADDDDEQRAVFDGWFRTRV